MTGFESKRNMAQTKMDDDDAQGYIAEYEEALLIAYQSGFADGKRSAQRKPLTEWQVQDIVEAESWGPDAIALNGQLLRTIRRTEAAYGIKEET